MACPSTPGTHGSGVWNDGPAGIADPEGGAAGLAIESHGVVPTVSMPSRASHRADTKKTPAEGTGVLAGTLLCLSSQTLHTYMHR